VEPSRPTEPCEYRIGGRPRGPRCLCANPCLVLYRNLACQTVSEAALPERPDSSLSACPPSFGVYPGVQGICVAVPIYYYSGDRRKAFW
jgi:hypothetical protein